MNLELLEQDWVRVLFTEFCRSSELQNESGQMTARMDRYAVFFRQLDQACTSSDQMTQTLLLELFGAEGLRRNFLAVRFLVKIFSLEWNADLVLDFAEQRRIAKLLQNQEGEPWAPVLERYYRHLTQPELSVKQRTVRLYVKAAIGFLKSVKYQSNVALSQEQIDRYTQRYRGYRASLGPFVQFLSLPRTTVMPNRNAPQRLERDAIRRARSLLQDFRKAADGSYRRALLVVLLSRLYQVPMQQLLSLTVGSLQQKGSRFTLCFKDSELLLSPEFGEALLALREQQKNGFLFPGRNRLQPLSPAAVYYQVHRGSGALLPRKADVLS